VRAGARSISRNRLPQRVRQVRAPLLPVLRVHFLQLGHDVADQRRKIHVPFPARSHALRELHPRPALDGLHPRSAEYLRGTQKPNSYQFAAEITGDLEAALEQFSIIAEDLKIS